MPPSTHKPSSYCCVDCFQSLNITWQVLSVLLRVWLPLCVCVCVCEDCWGMWLVMRQSSLLCKTFRIKKLYNYTKAEAKVATSVCWILQLSQTKSSFWLDLQEKRLSHSQPSPAASTTLQSCSCFPKELICCFPCFISQNMLASFQFEYSNAFCPAEMQPFTFDQ